MMKGPTSETDCGADDDDDATLFQRAKEIRERGRDDGSGGGGTSAIAGAGVPDEPWVWSSQSRQRLGNWSSMI